MDLHRIMLFCEINLSGSQFQDEHKELTIFAWSERDPECHFHWHWTIDMKRDLHDIPLYICLEKATS